MKEEQCCVVSCEQPLDAVYWEAQYKANATGWDLGQVSPPIKTYIDTINNKDSKILIPGCGNGYEAQYLVEKGFTDITVIDIAPTPVANLKEKFKNNSNINIILGDFFEHQQKYDVIIEQTFFCALPPTMRPKYVWKMFQLLKDQGKLVGLLFNRTFEKSPPFGGSKTEYENLFSAAFDFIKMDVSENSVSPRAQSELFIEFSKNSSVSVNLYKFNGITCSGCMATVTNKFEQIEGVLKVNMSTDFSEVLVVSTSTIPTSELQSAISYDEKYSIALFK